MLKKYHEILGWYGVVAILAAYFLLTVKILPQDNLFFQFLNLTGSIGVLTDAYFQKNYQPVVLNIIWAVIAMFGIVQIIL